MVEMDQKEIKYIEGFPRWGCYVATLASFVARHRNRSWSTSEFKKLYKFAVEMGYILHNEKPTDGSQGEWWRCFLNDPVRFTNLLIEKSVPVLNHIRLDSMYRSSKPGGDLCAICYRTVHGHHFALGNSKGHLVWNPDSSLKLLGVDSYRNFWLA